MTRLPPADRTMRARRPGTCPLCGPILVGQYIARCGSAWYHAACIVRSLTNDVASDTADEDGAG